MVEELKKEEEPRKKSKKLLWIILPIIAVIVLAIGGIFSWKFLVKGEAQFDKNAKGQSVQPVVGKKMTKNIVAAKGGVLKLGKDTLTLEKESLPTTEKISVAKIDSIGGLDSSWQYVSGVQLGPDGTELDKLSTLKMDLPADVAANENLMGFSYSGDGKDFHLYPITLEGNTATFQLTGFSGYGILVLQDQNKYPDTPSTIQAQARQIIAKITRGGIRRSGGMDEDTLRRVKNILLGWYKTSVKPQLKDAASDDTKLEAALSEFMVWSKFVNFYLADDDIPELEEAKNLAAAAVKSASEKASKACTTQKDPTQATKLMRYYKLAAGMLEGREGLSSEKIQEMIKKCVNFELKITSNISESGFGTTSSVEGSGSGYLTVNNAMKLSGEATFTVSRNQIEGMKPCRITTGNKETWEITIPEINMDSGKSSKMDVEIDLYEPDALNWDCLDSLRDKVTDVSETDPNESWSFDLLHQDELLNHSGETMNFLLKDWEVVNSGGVFARKKYERTKPNEYMPGVIFKENTIFELIHSPK